MRRHEIGDEQWAKIKDLLAGKPRDPGRTAEDNRHFINGVLWIAKAGAPWRDPIDRVGLDPIKGVTTSKGAQPDYLLPLSDAESLGNSTCTRQRPNATICGATNRTSGVRISSRARSGNRGGAFERTNRRICFTATADKA